MMIYGVMRFLLSLRSRAAAECFQENLTVLGESFHGFPSIICIIARDQAIIVAPSANFCNSPQRHRDVPHGTRRIGIRNRSEAMPRTALQQSGVLRLNAKCRPSATPSILLQRRALCHGAEPLAHVFLTNRAPSAVLVILTSAAL